VELIITRHPSSAPALVLGYFFLTAATLLFGLLIYIGVIGFEEPIPRVSHGPLFFIRHVVLVPGFFPWLITATWVATLHFGGRVLRGIGFIGVSIVIHYVVFATSAHSDVVYPWAQCIEVLFSGYCLQSMIRRVARPAPALH
jgi:hypothetical protein